MFLLGLLSALLIAVAFRHLSTKPLFYFACLYIYFAVFSRRGYCRLAAIVFAAWVVVIFILAAIFCLAIFIAAVHFIAVQLAISRLFIQGWTLSCRFCSGPVVAIFILLLTMLFKLTVQDQQAALNTEQKISLLLWKTRLKNQVEPEHSSANTSLFLYVLYQTLIVFTTYTQL